MLPAGLCFRRTGSSYSEGPQQLFKRTAATIRENRKPPLGEPVTLGTPQCPGGYLDQSTINTGVLDPINAARQQVVKGMQENGQSGAKLPAGKDLTQLSWACDLEQTAIKALNDGQCPETEPANPGDKGTFFDNQYYYDYPVSTILANEFKDNYLSQITANELKVQGTKVTYSGPVELRPYANLIRPATTGIGCAFNVCPGPPKKYTMYCILNSK
ncbi:SCP-like protein [Ancylostoma duodenale]|uniref:SCP-like protein n=1 Tax=Ancylostoma duodenale TaxID=51022 RepID=A0A0C2GB78_9BILA|nr:SCP-like protein [Ancylostoma duodenale]